MKTILKTTAAALALAVLLPAASASAQQADIFAPLRALVPAQAAPAVRATHAHRAGHATHAAHAMHMGRGTAHHVASRRVAVPARLRAAKAAPRKQVDQFRIAEAQGFKKVSDLVAFPPFYPTLGIVTVKPDTLPVGPFRCFDRSGRLVSTVYMLPLKDLDDHKQWDKVQGLPAPVDHATAYFHPGHAGVQMPHYHLVLWHVKDEASVAK